MTELLPLDSTTLAAIAGRGVPVPTYDRGRLAPRIVHLGVGGFHRAHMALYTDELAERGGRWGIRGLGLLPGDRAMADALGPQDGLYTLTEKGSTERDTRIVGSIVDYVLATDEPGLAAAAIADPATAILSLTITEAGYAEPEPGQRTTLDSVAACLDRRRADAAGPITILSCDNLPGNGDVARRALSAAAARRSVELARWVDRQCTFPNTMVDRITPVTDDADRRWLADTYGIGDRWPVVAEPFRQWVIQDHFAAGRPAWEDAGALFTDDVHAWELYKLRLLNAGHSCIAYLSALAGITYVDEALATPEIHRYLQQLLMREALPTLTPIPGHPREDYVRVVIERFANTGVRDQIARLCIDGTAKFPTFLIPTIVGQIQFGGPIERAALALAGWHRYLSTVPRDQQSFDAAGDAPRDAARASATDPVRFLDFDAVFPNAVSTNERFRDVFAAAAASLAERGPIGAIASLADA